MIMRSANIFKSAAESLEKDKQDVLTAIEKLNEIATPIDRAQAFFLSAIIQIAYF
ncbi:MAG: hypothetical protein WBG90_07110 [Saonia sp.]